MHVEMDAFSGRPNPSWELDAEEAEQVARLVAPLTALAAPEELPTGLGYRGFHLVGLRGADELVVWREVVQNLHDGGVSQWRDPERSLEQFLLKSAQPHVDSSLYAVMMSLVNTP